MNFLKLFTRNIPTEEKTDKKNIIILVSVIAGAILIAAGVAFLIYRLVQKRAEMEYEEFDDDPESDFFEEED